MPAALAGDQSQCLQPSKQLGDAFTCNAHEGCYLLMSRGDDRLLTASQTHEGVGQLDVGRAQCRILQAIVCFPEEKGKLPNEGCGHDRISRDEHVEFSTFEVVGNRSVRQRLDTTTGSALGIGRVLPEVFPCMAGAHRELPALDREPEETHSDRKSVV